LSCCHYVCFVANAELYYQCTRAEPKNPKYSSYIGCDEAVRIYSVEASFTEIPSLKSISILQSYDYSESCVMVSPACTMSPKLLYDVDMACKYGCWIEQSYFDLACRQPSNVSQTDVQRIKTNRVIFACVSGNRVQFYTCLLFKI